MIFVKQNNIHTINLNKSLPLDALPLYLLHILTSFQPSEEHQNYQMVYTILNILEIYFNLLYFLV